ncbi:unnamed protein product [Rotaria socialis]|uniref:Phosphoglycerate mutase n=1 Tax=Rotaria socialis TaxID=392032 RepID=A0A818YW36_9BILA|nr:unnamed protein product [Rotaria socialis]CAF4613744.1 unnamed protein product [Rotaria socialis]
MDIYFVRHGESTYNVNPLDDSIDCPLTTLGVEQSIKLKPCSYPNHYSLIICSPLRRCIDTIKLSKITCDHFEINDLFREIRSGSKSDLLNENEKILFENEQEIKQRINQINNYLIEKKKLNIYSNILIVTHADLIWNLTAYQIDDELFGKWIENAQLLHWKKI